MTCINLLPWREDLRKIKNNSFYALVSMSIAMGLIIVLIIHFILHRWIKIETNNITIIQAEQKDLLSKIKAIQDLQKNKQDLLARRDIIQSLQEDRSLIVRFLDALPRMTPEGLVLTSIERKGSQVIILGTAQTPASISMLYKNLEDKQWNNLFSQIKINEILLEKNQVGVGFVLEFTLKKDKDKEFHADIRD